MRYRTLLATAALVVTLPLATAAECGQPPTDAQDFPAAAAQAWVSRCAVGAGETLKVVVSIKNTGATTNRYSVAVDAVSAGQGETTRYRLAQADTGRVYKGQTAETILLQPDTPRRIYVCTIVELTTA